MTWLDNVHINTTNGLWKSILVGQWKADFGTAPLDPSNYLYYPLVSILCRGLDLLGIQAGETWRQMATVNTVFGGIAVAVVYWMVRRLTGRRDIAGIAALFHLGSAFFLSLAIMNEDIMPSYTLVLAAMAIAAVCFANPTIAQVASVAVIFTLGWLLEWRVMFPTLPPLLLALALSRGSILQRAGRLLVFLSAMTGVAFVTAYLWSGHNGATGLAGLLWTGKGVDTGWAGFSSQKLLLVVSGMGEYWLGGRNLVGSHRAAASTEWGLAFALQMVLLAAFTVLVWLKRRDTRLRTVAIVFVGTLVAGEIMNAYSQPADPQMQLNVMPWLAVAAALLLAEFPSSISRAAAATVVVLALVPLAYNVMVFGARRGSDARMLGALNELERLSDPATTIYVYGGSEGIITWQYALWTPRWVSACDLGPAPETTPKFKWIDLAQPVYLHPAWTTEQYTAYVKSELECAFDKGYRVVASSFWLRLDHQIDAWTAALRHGHDRGLALQSLLHTYHARPIGGPSVDYPEGYVEVTRP